MFDKTTIASLLLKVFLINLFSKSDLLLNILKNYISRELNNIKNELNRQANQAYKPTPYKIYLPAHLLVNQLDIRVNLINKYQKTVNSLI